MAAKKKQTAKKSAPKQKPAATKSKPAAKAKRAAKARRAAKSKPATKAKPAAKAKRAHKPAAKQPAAKQRTAAPKPRIEVASEASVDGHEALGEITAPSGRLAVFDVGLVGYLPRPALEPALVTTTVPSDRALEVVGKRVRKGRFADCWDHVTWKLGGGETRTARAPAGGVNLAPLRMDMGPSSWAHEERSKGSPIRVGGPKQATPPGKGAPKSPKVCGTNCAPKGEKKP